MLTHHLSTIRRSNGFYYIAWYDNNRRRYRSTGFTVKSQALLQLKELDGALQKEAYSFVSVIFQPLIPWRAHIKSKSEFKFASFRKTFASGITGYTRTKELESDTRKMYDDFMEGL